MKRILFACLVLSGAAGLLYELAWIRRLAEIMGSTSQAVGLVTAVFFIGLGAGSEIFGRIARDVRRPLFLYAGLEIGLAIMVLISPAGLDLVEDAFGRAWRHHSGAGAALTALRAGLAAIVLVPPALIMGGTLPLFAEAFVQHRDRSRETSGALYAANTLGALAGVLVTGFVLLPAVGVTRTLWTGALANVLAAAAALFAGAPMIAAGSESSAGAPVRRNSREAGWLDAGLVLFISGFLTLGLEVIWTRVISLLVWNRIHATTLMLAAVLAGISLGSLLARHRAFGNPRRLLPFLLAGTALAAEAALFTPATILNRLGPTSAGLLLVVPPMILAGITFPVGVAAAMRPGDHGGPVVGRLLALNTAGGAIGGLAAGLVVLPAAGLAATVIAWTGAALAGAVLVLLFFPGNAGPVPRVLAALLVAAVWIAIPIATGTRLPADLLAEGRPLIDYREGLEGNVAVIRRPTSRAMEIDRLWQGQDRPTHQLVAAHLPMILRPGAQRVLVIGAGAGQTPSRFLMHDIESLTCVDSETAVFALIREHFDHAWLDDPRVAAIVADGRVFTAHCGETFDVVSVEVGQLFRPGASRFYTTDFYRDVRSRLSPGGLLVQFLPLAFLAPAELRSVVATFLETFPEATLWYNTAECLLVGSAGPFPKAAAGDIARRLGRAEVAEDLAFSHWGGSDYPMNDAAVFLASFLMAGDGLKALAGDARPYHDEIPRLEAAMGGVRRTDDLDLRNAAVLESHLEPVDRILTVAPDKARGVRIAAIRDLNIGDILTEARLRRLDIEPPASPAERVMALETIAAANPENLKACRLLAEAQVLAGRVDAALPLYEKVAARSPEDAAAQRGLGYVLHRLGRPAEARPFYERAVALGMEDAELFTNLGAAQGEEGDIEDATRSFQKALVIDPGHREATDNLNRLKFYSGPVKIAPGGPCGYCSMPVDDAAFSAQAHLRSGSRLIFDDPGCVVLYLRDNSMSVDGLYFHHLREDRWIDAREVGFVPHEKTPMGFGFAAVDPSEAGAQSLAEIERKLNERFGR